MDYSYTLQTVGWLGVVQAGRRKTMGEGACRKIAYKNRRAMVHSAHVAILSVSDKAETRERPSACMNV